MSLLNRHQRAIVHAQTNIHPLIVDRVTEAFDALIDHQDVDLYKRNMMTALAQLNMPFPIPDEEKPTAVDRMKLMCVQAYASREHMPVQRAIARLKEMQKA